MVAPGTRFGPYEILAPLGAGGMGEVYRARDTRLGRAVAIKILPRDLANDPQRIARFEREARSASALSDPYVVSVYDVGREGDQSFLVTEIVEGGNLRELLERGPLPVRRALELAVQIASGLAAAHEQGIVHRDLKPENVLLTKQGSAKIADFGLAKLIDRADESNSRMPTSDGMQTSDGIVMGTVAYMSPEQASGRAVDFRSDQFAFGSILYEMLTGRPSFRRASAAETLSAVMRDDPAPLREVNPAAPPHLGWILDRCLAKEPGGRYASTRDLATELAVVREHLSDLTSGPLAGPAPSAIPAGRSVGTLWVALGAALLLAAAATVAWLSRQAAPAPKPVIRFSVPPPPNTTFFGQWDAVTFAISPDGSRLAFLGSTSGTSHDAVSAERPSLKIWVRALSDLEAKPIAGTEGASSLFWSPDSRSIGFFAENQLKRVDADGGAPGPICEIPTQARRTSGTWGAGEILFSSTFEGVIYRVAAEGGAAAALHRPEAARGEKAAVFPQVLPDGKSFLYVSVRADGGGQLMEGSLDGRPSRTVAPLASRAEYCEPGFLLFARDGSLFAQRFDPGSAKLTGPLLSVSPSVYYFYSDKWAGFSISRTGTLAFRPRGNVTRLTWFDRSGQALGELGTPNAGETITVALSPDGRKVLFDRTRPDLNTFDLWTIDLARNVETRLTSDPNTECYAVWLPDGRHIVYSVVRDFLPWLVLRDLAGETEKRLLLPGTFQIALGVTPDGEQLIFSQAGGNDLWGIWSVSLKGDSAPQPVVVSKYSQSVGDLSPDGRFIAYISNESGQRDAYVRSIAPQAEPVRVSTNGVVALRWSRGGQEIYYTSPDRHLFAVSVKTTPTLEIGIPRMLFSLPAEGWRAFDVSSDGRFLAAVQQVSYATAPLEVVVNALSEMKH